MNKKLLFSFLILFFILIFILVFFLSFNKANDLNSFDYSYTYSSNLPKENILSLQINDPDYFNKKIDSYKLKSSSDINFFSKIHNFSSLQEIKKNKRVYINLPCVPLEDQNNEINLILYTTNQEEISISLDLNKSNIADCNFCGNNICEPDFNENEENCIDCSCGNNTCESSLNEDIDSCYEDCHCGDNICDLNINENQDNCAKDCYCGDALCNENFEDANSCYEDCHFGDGVCDLNINEDRNNTPNDCFCGDGVCNLEYEANNCIDCTCGNNTCDIKYENNTNCTNDCYCGDGFCLGDENKSNCIEDCNYSLTFIKDFSLDSNYGRFNIKSIVEAKNNNYILTANRYNIHILKLSFDGNILWSKLIDNVTSKYENTKNRRSVTKIRSTKDGNYIVLGRINQEFEPKIYLIKIDPEGNILWEKIIDQSFLPTAHSNSILETDDNGFLISATSGNIHPDIYLIKVDNLGNYKWNRSFGNENSNERVTSLSKTSNGYVLSGSTTKNSVSKGLIIKVDKSGNQDWNYITSKTFFNNVQQIKDNKYIATGAGFNASQVVKLDSLGNKEWLKTYGGEEYSSITISSLSKTKDQAYIFTGKCNPLNDNKSKYYAYLLKTDSLGNTEWQRHFECKNRDCYSEEVHQTSDLGYILTGATIVIKTDSNGLVDNQHLYEDPKLENNFYRFLDDPYLKVYNLASSKLDNKRYTMYSRGENLKLMEIDSNGDLNKWIYDLLSSSAYTKDLIKLEDNGFLVLLNKYTSDIANYNPILIRVDENKKIVWKKTYSDFTTRLRPQMRIIKNTEDSVFLFLQKDQSSNNKGDKIGILNIDLSTGNILFEKDISEENTRLFLRNIKKIQDNSFLILAYESGCVSGCVNNHKNNLFLYKIDSSANIIDSLKYKELSLEDTNLDVFIKDIKICNSNIFLLGNIFKEINDSTISSPIIFKSNSDLSLDDIWSQTFELFKNNPENNSNIIYDLDSNIQSVYLTSTCGTGKSNKIYLLNRIYLSIFNSNTRFNYSLAKLDTSNLNLDYTNEMEPYFKSRTPFSHEHSQSEFGPYIISKHGFLFYEEEDKLFNIYDTCFYSNPRKSSSVFIKLEEGKSKLEYYN